jgi:DNA-binding NarL/FixJ family response regulator
LVSEDKMAEIESQPRPVMPEWVGKRKGKRKSYIGLTKREESVLLQLEDSKIEVIAMRLGIDDITVRSHISIIRRKIKDAKAFLQYMKRYEKILRKE